MAEDKLTADESELLPLNTVEGDRICDAWYAVIPDAREYALCRVIHNPKHGYSFDVWSGVDGEWINDGDANPFWIARIVELKERPSLQAQNKRLREALEKSQQALIGITSELGVIEAQMPGGLPYGIKKPKIAVDLAICANAKALSTTEAVTSEKEKEI